MTAVSIVISTHNDAPGSCNPPHQGRSLIVECLESIRMTLAADPTPVELLVADDDSTDDTHAQISATIDRWRKDQVTDRLPVKYLRVTERGGVAARLNDLIGLAGGQIIARLDADVAMISMNWAARVARHFADDSTSGVGILGGVQLGTDSRTWAFGDSLFNEYQSYQHLNCGEPCPPPGELKRVDYNMMCFGAFTRDLWRRVGGFDSSLGRYEEVEFQLRCTTTNGGRVTHVTSDIVFEHRARLRQKRNGTWDDGAAIEAARKSLEERWGFDWRSADPRKALERWPDTALTRNLKGRN
ncbi:MAG: glycosyltransferase [Phycisphaeraceae bacterium]|nr:glycosyltransferase [Phycisphaeraceae bacterium]